MNLSRTLPNFSMYEPFQLTTMNGNFYDPSMMSPSTEQFYPTYQYNSNLIPIRHYPTDNYHIPNDYISYPPSSSFVCSPEQIVNTVKIHINPFFKPRSSDQTTESSSEIEQQQNSTLSSRSRTRSLSSDRQVIESPKQKQQTRQKRKLQREKFIQQKELIFQRRSSLLISKSKHRHASPNRWEHKQEKLQRLYEDYSSEEPYKHWKPSRLQDCFELCQYALDKHNSASLNNTF